MLNNTFEYGDARPSYPHRYLWPAIEQEVRRRAWPSRRAFDLGCGSGATAKALQGVGFDVTGVDLAASGVAEARRAYPGIRFEVDSAYDDLAGKYGRFDLVVSLEVIEHLTAPRKFARTFLSLIAPGGLGVLSTPYHGYAKNLALALAGQMDWHFMALSDAGHIKFFSIATLAALLAEAGAKNIRFRRVGRIPPLAKSMIAIVEG